MSWVCNFLIFVKVLWTKWLWKVMFFFSSSMNKNCLFFSWKDKNLFLGRSKSKILSHIVFLNSFSFWIEIGKFCSKIKDGINDNLWLQWVIEAYVSCSKDISIATLKNKTGASLKVVPTLNIIFLGQRNTSLRNVFICANFVEKSLVFNEHMAQQWGDQPSFVMQTADVKYMYFDKLFQLEVKNKFISRCQKTFSWTEKVCMAVKTYFFLQNTLIYFLNVNLYSKLEFQ